MIICNFFLCSVCCSNWKKTLAYLLVLPGSRARIVRCGGRYDPQLVKRSSEWVSEFRMLFIVLFFEVRLSHHVKLTRLDLIGRSRIAYRQKMSDCCSRKQSSMNVGAGRHSAETDAFHHCTTAASAAPSSSASLGFTSSAMDPLCHCRRAPWQRSSPPSSFFAVETRNLAIANRSCTSSYHSHFESRSNWQ